MGTAVSTSTDIQLSLLDNLCQIDGLQVDGLNNLEVVDSDRLDAVDSVAVVAPNESIDALTISSQYLASLQNKQDIDDTQNALLRYFIPSVGGPIPAAKKRRPISPSEVQAGFEFLKTISLTSLANAPDIALKTINELNSSSSQKERVRRNLRSLVDWAQKSNYIIPSENPIPKGRYAYIKIGLYKGLNLKPANARQILERYLEQVDDREAKIDTINSAIRFFVPICDGPFPYHKPARDFEIEAGMQYLEEIPLEYLNHAPELATVALDALDLTVCHGTRIRNALRDLIKWAIAERYLPEPHAIAPWGGELLSQELLEIATQAEKQQTLFEIYKEYCRHLEQNGRATEINSLQTAVVRHFVLVFGGSEPIHARATVNEIQAGLDHLKTVPLDQLSNGIELMEQEFDRRNVPLAKRRPIRSRLRGWLNWSIEQSNCSMTDEKQAPQPVFNTFYTNGVQRKHKKPGMAQYESRCPNHALCAKQFSDDYINNDLQKQLDAYSEWRRSNDVTPGSITTEKDQILQVLGWLHRYEGISLSELRFENLITKSQLIFWANQYSSYEDYLKQKEIGTQDARRRADDDKERVERYLAFTGKNANSQTRRLFIVISIAKFLYKDVRGSDDFPDDRDIPILRRLFDLQAGLQKKAKSTLQTVRYSETSVSWEQAIMAMQKERSRADLITTNTKNRTFKGYEVRKRPETAIANDLQRFLSIIFLLLVPSRARTFYDLRIGETFKEGILDSGSFLSVQDLRNEGKWEQCKNDVKFYIHHTPQDFKVGKSMTPALLESEGWWVEIYNISFGSNSLYDYVRRWLDWGRATEGPVDHHFFFRACGSSEPIDGHGWSHRIKKIFDRWTGVPVPPKNIRKMFASKFPEYKASAALLLQHSEKMHDTNYDLRRTVKKMEPVMNANAKLIEGVVSNL